MRFSLVVCHKLTSEKLSVGWQLEPTCVAERVCWICAVCNLHARVWENSQHKRHSTMRRVLLHSHLLCSGLRRGCNILHVQPKSLQWPFYDGLEVKVKQQILNPDFAAELFARLKVMFFHHFIVVRAYTISLTPFVVVVCINLVNLNQDRFRTWYFCLPKQVNSVQG